MGRPVCKGPNCQSTGTRVQETGFCSDTCLKEYQDIHETNPVKKPFWVIWTYMGNYSNMVKVMAFDAREAMNRCTGMFGQDFQNKGSVYVLESEPFCFLKGTILDCT